MKPETRAFLSPDRAQALGEFPQLRDAFATREALEATAKAFKPGNEAVFDAVKREIRTLGAQQIESRGTFDESPALHKAVQLHTAYNRLEAGLDGAVPREHRTIIAEYADRAIDRAPRGTSISSEATWLAGALASRSAASDPSPFRSERLTAIYERQQQFMAYVEARSAEPDRTLMNSPGRVGAAR